MACHPEELFGFWAMEASALQRYVALAKGADLEKLRAESKATAEKAAGDPLYRLTPDGIAIVSISGPMTKHPTSFQSIFGGTSTIRTREALRAAVRDPDVGGIMVVVDSRGGTVGGGAELAADLRRAGSRKPLHTFADDAAHSAGYLALAQGGKVWANANAEIGSIGVYTRIEDTSGQFLQEGVKVYIVSSAPPFKGAGEPGTEITPDQLAEWRRRIVDVADWFVGEVAAPRKRSREDVQKWATGQSWVAEKARELGLIDGVLTFDEALARLRSEVMEKQDTDAALALANEAESKATAEKAAREVAEKKAADAIAQAATLQERLAKIESAQRAELFAAKAKDLKLPKEAAELLDRVEAAAGAELFGKLEQHVKALGAQVKESALFGEIGSSVAADGDASPASKIDALAAEMVKAGKAKTLAEAVTLVAQEHPDLYRLHVEEQRKGAR